MSKPVSSRRRSDVTPEEPVLGGVRRTAPLYDRSLRASLVPSAADLRIRKRTNTCKSKLGGRRLSTHLLGEGCAPHLACHCGTRIRPSLELTGFVGRRAELAEATRLLGTYRLVTSTGFGGVGKTRLRCSRRPKLCTPSQTAYRSSNAVRSTNWMRNTRGLRWVGVHRHRPHTTDITQADLHTGVFGPPVHRCSRRSWSVAEFQCRAASGQSPIGRCPDLPGNLPCHRHPFRSGVLR